MRLNLSFKSIILSLVFVAFGIFLVLYFNATLRAAGGQIDPDGAGGTTQGTRDTVCSAVPNWDCVNDGVSSTTIPDTTGDYVTFGRNQLDSYTLGTISNVASATAVQVFIYHQEFSTNMRFEISLWDAAETTQYGTTQNVTNRTASQWDSVTISGLNLTQAQLDGMRVRTTCTKPLGGAASSCRNFAMYAYVTYNPNINVVVGTTSNMRNLNAGTTTAHTGGVFVISENTSSRNITSITLTETGTIDASANLKNIQLRFDYDQTNPYNCADQVYDGNEPQYGSTDSDGFSSANGTSTFASSTVSISTTQSLCIYPVLDVQSTANASDTIKLQITSPATEVVGSGSAVVRPEEKVVLGSTTTIQKANLQQMRYHWRDDNGDEIGATSATGGTENTPLPAIPQLQTDRLRILVSNEGNTTSASTAFRLEYAQKTSTCSAASGWTDVGASGGDWDMADSTFITDGGDTTDISLASGGVTNENSSFKSPNAGLKDTSSQVATTTLTSSEFIEMEFAVAPTTNATEGNTYCFRLTNAGAASLTYSVYPEATINADLLVVATGTQSATVNIPSTNQYSGGGFIITDSTPGAHVIGTTTIFASGTVDYVNDIKNIRLFYDLDTTAPYDCIGETYGGSEAQFGATNTIGFAANGSSTFVGTVTASTTRAVCFYVVYDATTTITNGETIDFYIQNPRRDIKVNTGSVAPSTQVAITGVTTFVKTDPQQIHYHWRDDSGNETGATSTSNGAQDTPITQVTTGLPYRLRIGISNEGGASATNYQYRLEYAQKLSTCSAATGWTRVNASGGAWSTTTSQLTEGADTTNIAIGIGGVTDENSSYLTTNGAQRESTDQTGNITLTTSQYVDLEYAIRATASSTEGATYCFRVTNAGVPLDTYVRYPEATTKLPTDFLVQRGATTTTAGTVTLRAGIDYVAPSASTSAFIRITNTHHTGAGDNAGTGNQNADDVTAYITNPANILTSVTIVSPSAANNTRIAWEIVEYIGDPGGDNEFIVRQQGQITYGVTSLGATTSAASGIVTDADVVVFITGQGNPDTARADYNTGLSTARWNASADTATFNRGEHGNDAVIVSYAVVEFTGQNWAVQRVSHTYTNAGSTETENITAIGSLTRAFIHAQKRVGANLDTHEDFGHEVWLSSIGQVSFRLDGGANTPSGHVSVAWIIENTQTVGDRMVVTRSSGPTLPGTAPLTTNVDIGKTLDDITVSSIFINNSGSGAGNSFPEPMISARIISTTQYELWISNTGDTRAYQTEIVEWPTAARKITQNYYRIYVNNDLLDPTDPWPVGATDLGENTEVTGLDSPIATGQSFRIRMSLQVSASAMLQGVDAFKLQYGERVTTCSAIASSEWKNLGDTGSTTALWRASTTSLSDGTVLSTDPPAGGALNLSVSDVAGSFEKENDTIVSPYRVEPGEDVEYDWAVQDNGANDKTSYCFRMVEADGTSFTAYNFYPTMRTVGYGAQSQNWRWYDDAQNETPTTTLAATNTTPIDIDYDNTIKLRLTLREVNGAAGVNVKFRLQFSESSSFSTTTGIFDVATTSSCTNLSLWCYADGGGVDNATITTKTLGDANSCSGSLGTGCGTHNETPSATSTYRHNIGAATEFSFTIRNSGARVNRVYYFRAYDVVNNEAIPLGSGYSYPSLTTAGASLTFEVLGVATGTVAEGVTTDFATTPTGLSFRNMLINTDYEVAQQTRVTTNATQGYQIFVYSPSALLSPYGIDIDPISSTNASPASWNTACSATSTGCFGYHAGDDTLFGGSTRFSADDTYARMSTSSPEEIVYSSGPVTAETAYVIFKLKFRQLQEAGIYETRIRYITIPIF